MFRELFGRKTVPPEFSMRKNEEPKFLVETVVRDLDSVCFVVTREGKTYGKVSGTLLEIQGRKIFQVKRSDNFTSKKSREYEKTLKLKRQRHLITELILFLIRNKEVDVWRSSKSLTPGGSEKMYERILEESRQPNSDLIVTKSYNEFGLPNYEITLRN